MEECRAYCALIHKARIEHGFEKVKYPISDIFINRYFLPDYRRLIAEECNIVGYMDIQPVNYSLGEEINLSRYKQSIDEGRSVWISILRSDWQEKLYSERVKSRQEAEERKRISKLDN